MTEILNTYAGGKLPLILMMVEFKRKAHQRIEQIRSDINDLKVQNLLLINEMEVMSNAEGFTADTYNQLFVRCGKICEFESQITKNEELFYQASNYGSALEALFLPHLLSSAYLEINNTETMKVAVELKTQLGWSGTPVLNTDRVSNEERHQIEGILNGVVLKRLSIRNGSKIISPLPIA